MRAIRWTLAFVVGAVGLVGAAPADAVTFCVHHDGCLIPGRNFGTIQQAVDAADGNDGTPAGVITDTILVGTGDYDPFTNASGHPIDVIGSGATTVVRVAGDTGDNKTVVALGDFRDTMRGLAVRLPAGSNDIGVHGGTLTGVDVHSAGNELGTSAGISGVTFSDGTIEVPGGAGASLGSRVSRSTISATVGVRDSDVEDSVVRVSGGGTGVLSNGTVRVRHVDLLGEGGGAPSTAVRVMASFGNDASADVRSSIIRGFTNNFDLEGSSVCLPGCVIPTFNFANLTIAYSDYDPATPSTQSGASILNDSSPGQNTAADPGFVSTSDPHLRFDSALVDAGDPASPGTGDSATDLDGLSRKVDGKGSGTPRADIGAFEYQRRPPQISAATASTGTPSVHEPVTFHGAATDPDGEAVTLSWDFGDGGTATGADVSHTFEAAGQRTVQLTARDAAGASSTQDIALDVVNHAPVLTLSAAPAKPLAGQATAFHAITTDPDGDAVAVAWDFGDGRHATGSGPHHTFATAGTKTVSATATDPGGASAVQTLQLLVRPSCRVPKLKGLSLRRARAAIKQAHCALGKLHKKKPALVVRSQTPKTGRIVARGTKVSLTLGPKPKKKKKH